jgi:hypothetical protein
MEGCASYNYLFDPERPESQTLCDRPRPFRKLPNSDGATACRSEARVTRQPALLRERLINLSRKKASAVICNAFDVHNEAMVIS